MSTSVNAKWLQEMRLFLRVNCKGGDTPPYTIGHNIHRRTITSLTNFYSLVIKLYGCFINSIHSSCSHMPKFVCHLTAAESEERQAWAEIKRGNGMWDNEARKCEWILNFILLTQGHGRFFYSWDFLHSISIIITHRNRAGYNNTAFFFFFYTIIVLVKHMNRQLKN